MRMWAETAWTMSFRQNPIYRVPALSSSRRRHTTVKVPLSTSGKIVEKFSGHPDIRLKISGVKVTSVPPRSGTSCNKERNNTETKPTDQPLLLFTSEHNSNSPVWGFPWGTELKTVSTGHVGFWFLWRFLVVLTKHGTCSFLTLDCQKF